MPKSALLSKLHGFLPQMEAANQKLKEDMQVQPASNFDVENVPEDQEHGFIEMDLACGLIDLKDEEAIKAAEAALAGERPDLLQNLGESSDEDDSSSSDSGDDGMEDAPSSDAQNAPLNASGPAGRAADPVGEGQRHAAPRSGPSPSSLAAGRGNKRKQRPNIVEL